MEQIVVESCAQYYKGICMQEVLDLENSFCMLSPEFLPCRVITDCAVKKILEGTVYVKKFKRCCVWEVL